MNCPICGCMTGFNGEDYHWCRICHTIRTVYDYDPKIYGAFYAAHYEELSPTAIGIRLNGHRLGLLRKYATIGSRVLDYGCSVGDFVRVTGKEYCGYGFEPNPVARRLAGEGVFEELDGHRDFSVITLWDVFEHLPNPHESFKDIKARLASGGKIIMTVPNGESLAFGDDAALKAWKHWKPREHLFVHSYKGLEVLAARYNMEVIHCDYDECAIRPGNRNRDLLTVVIG